MNASVTQGTSLSKRPTFLSRFVRMISVFLVSLLLLLSMAWGVCAIWYQFPDTTWLRIGGIVIWSSVLITALFLFWFGQHTYSLCLWLVAMVVILGWWSSLRPSNDRIWADDVAQQLHGEINGDIATLHQVRNFDWHTEKDYTAHWETRQYDLSKLRSVDVALSYWMGPAIAHTLVSFGFADNTYVTFSVEIRKERNESFSAIGGFFRQFEASVVAADEKDILRVRTNVRGEDVYLYRVNMPQQAMRDLFISYIDEANKLVKQPRFYNTLTANCTTIVFDMVNHIIPGLPLDYRLLASGYLPEYLYTIGALNKTHTVDQLQALGRITDRAKQADTAPDFSQQIREGIPVP